MQFFPYFREAGYGCDVYHAYGRLYNRVFDTPGFGAAYKVLTRAKRSVRTALTRADLLFLQRLAFPQNAWSELIAHRRGIPMIFDFDDAIYLGAGGRDAPNRSRAFHQGVALAEVCIAGNAFLAEAAGAPDKTVIIPTVIDTDRYVPAARNGDEVVIGWMGTAGNFGFLGKVAPSIRRALDERPHTRFRIVSNATFTPLADHPRVEQIRWSAGAEIELLQSFDIGLMPLEDSPLTRGKCAFKMIQYMAVGTSVVVSAVGANKEVFADRELGHLVDDFDWTDALLDLIDNPDKRATTGAAGRKRAVEAYSVASVVPRYLEIFERFT